MIPRGLEISFGGKPFLERGSPEFGSISLCGKGFPFFRAPEFFSEKLLPAGHHGPVFAVGADSDEVGAFGEHDEAVPVGSEPGIVG